MTFNDTTKLGKVFLINISYTFMFIEVDSVAPQNGSLGGGTRITMSGKGMEWIAYKQIFLLFIIDYSLLLVTA